MGLSRKADGPMTSAVALDRTPSGKRWFLRTYLEADFASTPSTVFIEEICSAGPISLAISFLRS